MASESSTSVPPELATGAVLMPSVGMPEGAQKVEELDFNKFQGRAITVDDLLDGMKHMGFQASSMAEAIRIINDMVSLPSRSGRKPVLARSDRFLAWPIHFPFLTPSSSASMARPFHR